jgi:hypothetical protein
VARLGEGVMKHSLAVFARGGELTREVGGCLYKSNPADS